MRCSRGVTSSRSAPPTPRGISLRRTRQTSKSNKPTQFEEFKPRRGARLGGICFSSSPSRKSPWRMKRLGHQAAQDKPTIGGTLGQPAHEVGAPVGAEGNVNLQGVAACVNLLLQIAANPVNHLEFVLLARELPAGNFLPRMGQHRRVVCGNGREEVPPRGALE